MGVIWQKVWYDIWHNKLRTMLAVLSIASGVFAVGGIFGMADQMLSGMDKAHQSVNPSRVAVYLNTPVDRETLLGLRKVPGVEDVEPINGIAVRYKLHPEDKWALGYLNMRDYEQQRYDFVELKSGAWPEKNDLVIERLASQFIHADAGDSVILEVGSRERVYEITGKIRHPFVPPPDFGGPAYFFVDGEGLERFGVPQGKYVQVQLRVTPYSADFAKEVASRVKDRLMKDGIAVGAVMYQDPNKHWGRVFVEGITMVMQVLAIVSLFMSLVLVLNTVTALITQQTNQIGVIKALGGTTRTVLLVYLAAVSAYGLLALLISLPLGMLMAFGLTGWFLNLFNIDYTVFRFSQSAVIMQVISAVAVPLLAALWPVLKGASITVRQAIASYGLGGDFGRSRLDQLVEWIGARLLPSAYAMALANSFRRKARLTLSLMVLVTAGALFLMVTSLASSLTATLDAEFGRRTYDISIQFNAPQRIDRAIAMAEEMDGVERATAWFSHPVTLLRQGQKTKEAGLGSDIQAVPVEDPMYRPLVIEGRWLEPGDDRVVVLNKDTANDNHIRVGDYVTLDLGELGKAEWQVVGLYQLVFGGNFNIDSIYAPMPAVLEAAKKNNRGSVIYVRSAEHSEPATKALMDRLESLYKQRGMDVSFSQTLSSNRQSANSQFNITTSMLLALACIVAVVGGIGLAGSLSISVIERTKEIGVLRAIGARSRTLGGMFIMEGVLQGLLSWLMALPISFCAGRFVARALGQTLFDSDLDYAYNLPAVFIWLGVILVISMLASLLPARNASRISVRESLAYE